MPVLYSQKPQEPLVIEVITFNEIAYLLDDTGTRAPSVFGQNFNVYYGEIKIKDAHFYAESYWARDRNHMNKCAYILFYCVLVGNRSYPTMFRKTHLERDQVLVWNVANWKGAETPMCQISKNHLDKHYDLINERTNNGT